MTGEEQLMIDVNKCKYRDSYTNFCLAEKDDIGETYTICTGTDCYFKQLARKTQECKELKQTLTEIKEIASKVLLNTHDLEQFKDADALFGALLEIHKKISECEVENDR